ncbi:MAG: response regulator [bacterium]
MKAIVVDDSKAMRMILARSLRALGFDVEEAGDGRQALDKLATIDAPDLALVDWNMPEMNGLELVRAMRAESRLAAMRVMMVTTETEISHVTQALESGADEYVMKPFTADAIREKLALLGFSLG